MKPSPMSFDYVAAFPLPADLIPERLRNLLTPVGINPREAVEVACLYEAPDRDGESLAIDSAYVDKHLGELVQDPDLSRYIL